MRNILGIVTEYGLLTTEHKQMRKAMNPAFSVQHLTAQADMYYEPISTCVFFWLFIQLRLIFVPSLVEILKSQLKDKPRGKVMHIYEWSKLWAAGALRLMFIEFSVSKITLDIICDTAFGYNTDSLRDPRNELAQAYKNLIALQSGTYKFVLTKFVSNSV
jgi:hypothetical protein